MAGKRFLLTTFGSLGDLHPYLAVGRGLAARGHAVTVGTQPIYRERVEGAGLTFHPVRPDTPDADLDPEFMARAMHPRRGPSVLVRELLLASIRDTYADLDAAAEGADVLVTNVLTFAAQLVAEKRRGRLKWASVTLAPAGFLSRTDPPADFRKLGPAGGLVVRAVKWLTRRWFRPWDELRRELGLPPTRRHPLFEGQFSPERVIALFSPAFAAPQPDWPANAVAAGFAFHDEPGAEPKPELEAFLAGGPAPVVFTLGSAAVGRAGDFFAESAAAAGRLGVRALLLTGRQERNVPPGPLPPGVACFPYAPYAAVLPRAAAVVHQGGVGTTAQALRAGRPALVVPFAFDQPDNAARAARLGAARVLPLRSYRAKRVARELRELLGSPAYAAAAGRVAAAVAAEDGVAAACAELEKLAG